MQLSSILLLLFVIFLTKGWAQESVWTLSQCISYAKDHNLTISEAEFNERVSGMQYEERKESRLPSFSLSASYGKNFGRSINPTTNTFENRTYNYTGINASGSVLLFGWFKKRNEIDQAKYLLQASSADLYQLKDDISLNVATGYLRILLAAEQINISKHQLEVSNRQVVKTDLLKAAGRSNGMDKSQVATQLATDSANYFKAVLNYKQSIIELKAILNLDMEVPFGIVYYEHTEIPIQTFMEATAENTYLAALDHLSLIKSGKYRIRAAEKNITAVKSDLYPQVSLGGSAGSNYSSTYYQYLPSGETKLMPWGKQLQNNFSQSVSLLLSVPVFNGHSKRYAIRRAAVEKERMVIQDQMNRLKLQQDVYSAFNDAQAALQTYYANSSAASNARLAYDFAEKRYDKGLISAVDLLVAQNTQYMAMSNQASAKYDLLFKLIVIDYFLGKEIELK